MQFDSCEVLSKGEDYISTDSEGYKHIRIPEGIRCVGEHAFHDGEYHTGGKIWNNSLETWDEIPAIWTEISSISFPASLEEIGIDAFEGLSIEGGRGS